MPFIGKNSDELMKAISDPSIFSSDLTENIPKDIIDLCKGLLNKDESIRFGFEEIITCKRIYDEILQIHKDFKDDHTLITKTFLSFPSIDSKDWSEEARHHFIMSNATKDILI